MESCVHANKPLKDRKLCIHRNRDVSWFSFHSVQNNKQRNEQSIDSEQAMNE